MDSNKVEGFFIPDNEVKLKNELDYSRIDDYIRTAEAFARSTYQSIYIIDYFAGKFLYVSPNSLFLCGMTPQQMMQLNYTFYIDHVPADEQSLLIKFNRVGFSFFNTLPVEERQQWYIQYDFHIINNGNPLLIHHKLTPLTMTSDGRIWLALCVVSPSNNSTPGHIEMHRMGSSDFFEFNLETNRWKQRRLPRLTNDEKTVISLTIQGLTSAEIAEKMFRSIDTIKKYRKNIFDKLGVRNISEAIISVTNNKLL